MAAQGRASGFQLKDAPGEDLIRAARTVAEGGAWLDPSVTARVLSAYRGSPGPIGPARTVAQLSAREVEVLQLIGRGLSNIEIANQLYISEVTVIKSHIGHIFSKPDLRDRAAAIVFAFDEEIVEPRQGRRMMRPRARGVPESGR